MDSRTTDKLVEAFKAQRDPIADSDLDDEQPVSIRVTLTLGEWRKFQRIQQSRGHVTKAERG